VDKVLHQNELVMKPNFHIVLFHPEIPHNTGAAGRLALATNSRLHLIRPLGFSLDEKHLRRTGLDYWPKVDLRLWNSLEELQASAEPGSRFWYLTTKVEHPYWDAPIKQGDYFVYGPESKGLPESLLEKNLESCLTIPMPGTEVRSLNLSTTVGIVLYEGMRRLMA
jgi:tRNA (cytidine/uridine-2'-O-)-methyltransferase